MRGRVAAATALAALAVAAPAFALDVRYDLVSNAPGDDGWFRGPVTLKWTVSGETGTTNCDTKYFTVDTADTAVTCTATDGGSGSFARTAQVRLDQRAPENIVATAARGPDSGGWYTAPVAVAFAGSDATSGIASCTSVTYSGPDAATASVSGTCRDRAGNVSAPASLPLAFDATAPALADLGATVKGVGATVRWNVGADAVQTTVVRQPGDGGAASHAMELPAGTRELSDGPLARGKTYTWTVTARDAAGNAVAATTTAAVRARTSSARPTVRWRGARDARYYNLQLFRGRRKVMSSWPTVARMTLHRTWRFRGRQQRLAAGATYAWYVWGGYGPRSQHRYGRLLAHGRVTIPKA